MFWHKKHTSPKKTASSQDAAEGDRKSHPLPHVETIPHEFYGGQDPVIYPHHDDAPASVSPVVPVVSVKKSLVEDESPKGAVSSHESSPPVRKTRIRRIVFVSLAVLVLVGGVSFVIIYQEVRRARTQPIVSSVQPIFSSETSSAPSASQSPSDTVSLPPTTTVSDVVPTPPSLQVAPLVLPTGSFPHAVDTDEDGLTDEEELVFGTDPGTFDSDSDGYPDGVEVKNLYSPSQFAPSRLIDSGFVREYIHPVLAYRVYYPAQWQLATVDTAGDQVLVSALQGDFIEIRRFSLQQGETFTDWFGRMLPAETYTDLRREKNRFGIDVFIRDDRLVAYVLQEQTLFVFVYRPLEEQSRLVHPYVMDMVVQSFRPTRDAGVLPAQAVIPIVATSSVDIADPSVVSSTEDTDANS